MPLTATATQAAFDDEVANPDYNSNPAVVHVTLRGEGRSLDMGDIFDALQEKLGSAAALTTALAGANNDLTFTARKAGLRGNAVTVAYVVAGNNTPLSVAVAGNAITVNVATDAGGLPTSTATQVRQAINDSAAASALVFAANAGADTGAGVVAAMAAAPLAGGLAKLSSSKDTVARGTYELLVAA